MDFNDIRLYKYKKNWFKNFVPTILMPVKPFQQINFGENIIESGRVYQNLLYWR